MDGKTEIARSGYAPSMENGEYICTQSLGGLGGRLIFAEVLLAVEDLLWRCFRGSSTGIC